MNILSIQSRVAYGYVGQTAATLPLQRLGHEVWCIDTVGYSNHLGYRTWRGRAHAPEMLREVLEGLSLLGILERCDAVLSGYLGEPGHAAVVAEAVAAVKAANPRALYSCDPVIGNRASGVFVRGGVAEAIETHLLNCADMVVPNVFELQRLTGMETTGLASARTAADNLLARFPTCRTCLVTSVENNGADRVGVLAVERGGAWFAETPRLDTPAEGAGDLFAALFLSFSLQEFAVAEALSRAVSATFGIIEATAAAGRIELQIVGAQDAVLASPRFRAARLD